MRGGPCVQGVLDQCRALGPGCVRSCQTAKGGDTFGFEGVRFLGFSKGREKRGRKEKTKMRLIPLRETAGPVSPRARGGHQSQAIKARAKGGRYLYGLSGGLTSGHGILPVCPNVFPPPPSPAGAIPALDPPRCHPGDGG